LAELGEIGLAIKGQLRVSDHPHGKTAANRLEWRTAVTVIAAIGCATAIMLVTFGVGWKTLNLTLRVTARISAVLFAFAFAARGAPGLKNWQAPAAIAFAACHFIHLGLIVTRAQVGDHLSMLADLPGIIVYAAVAFIGWRAFTHRSMRSRSRRMQYGEEGAYWVVWIGFGQFLVQTFLSAPAPRPLVYPALIGLLLGAAAFRVGWRFLERRKVAPSKA
jgi:hypothetical protein